MLDPQMSSLLAQPGTCHLDSRWRMTAVHASSGLSW